MGLPRRTLAVLAAGGALAAFAQAPSPPEAFLRADRGHCIACHQLPEGRGPASRADLGPRLEGTRMRALGREGLRQAIADPMRANPETVMPPFGRHRILEAAEIEALVEYLHALP
jgi:L-cysteine S-thiosulfotransferase